MTMWCVRLSFGVCVLHLTLVLISTSITPCDTVRNKPDILVSVGTLVQIKGGSLGRLMTAYPGKTLRCFSPVHLSPIFSPDDQQTDEPRGVEGVVTCHGVSFLTSAKRNLTTPVRHAFECARRDGDVFRHGYLLHWDCSRPPKRVRRTRCTNLGCVEARVLLPSLI